MKILNYFKQARNLALLSIILVFMALVRTVAECLWLTIWQTIPAPVNVLEPFLYAALLAAVACFALSLLVFHQRYKTVVAMAGLTIASLVLIKITYNI